MIACLFASQSQNAGRLRTPFRCSRCETSPYFYDPKTFLSSARTACLSRMLFGCTCLSSGSCPGLDGTMWTLVVSVHFANSAGDSRSRETRGESVFRSTLRDFGLCAARLQNCSDLACRQSSVFATCAELEINYVWRSLSAFICGGAKCATLNWPKNCQSVSRRTRDSAT